MQTHGLVVLFGSGETSPSGRKVWEWLFDRLEEFPRTIILETPAGFEPNSAQVAGEVEQFLAHRLQNYQPQSTIIAARKRGTANSPDNPELLAPLPTGNVLFMGPGSPTYAARQLDDSLAWHMLRATHRLGAAVVLASATTVAVSASAMPVYEIYKVGEEVHWHRGLDFFGSYGLSLVWVPHWNNRDGGEKLDTSRCYLGQDRFEQMRDLLPPEQVVVGLDEHTALVVDVMGAECRVLGQGSVTIIREGRKQKIESGRTFDINELGPFRMPEESEGIPVAVWEQVRHARAATGSDDAAPQEVVALVEARSDARNERDWQRADELRDQIAARGWQLLDTPDGPRLERKALER